MPDFYYTYSSDGSQPFTGGWTVVTAQNQKIADNIFKAYHPHTIPDVINCAGIYNEKTFKNTKMYHSGNFGKREQEHISAYCCACDKSDKPNITRKDIEDIMVQLSHIRNYLPEKPETETAVTVTENLKIIGDALSNIFENNLTEDMIFDIMNNNETFTGSDETRNFIRDLYRFRSELNDYGIIPDNHYKRKYHITMQVTTEIEYQLQDSSYLTNENAFAEYIRYNKIPKIKSEYPVIKDISVESVTETSYDNETAFKAKLMFTIDGIAEENTLEDAVDTVFYDVFNNYDTEVIKIDHELI